MKKKYQFHEYELENKKLRKIIVNINAQLEVASRLNWFFTNQLSEKETYSKRLQTEVLSLRYDLEKSGKEMSQY